MEWQDYRGVATTSRPLNVTMPLSSTRLPLSIVVVHNCSGLLAIQPIEASTVRPLHGLIPQEHALTRLCMRVSLMAKEIPPNFYLNERNAIFFKDYLKEQNEGFIVLQLAVI
ncbi:MAG: hypothetical protein NTX44_00400 [Ignavibacteriales bacterium]|nr:hypothetical protein [Ignavibacteriales bacterium]